VALKVKAQRSPRRHTPCFPSYSCEIDLLYGQPRLLLGLLVAPFFLGQTHSSSPLQRSVHPNKCVVIYTFYHEVHSHIIYIFHFIITFIQLCSNNAIKYFLCLTFKYFYSFLVFLFIVYFCFT